MIKKLLYLLVLTLFVFSEVSHTTAQTADLKWGIGVHGGLTRLNDDFQNNYFSTAHQKRFLTLSLNRFINSNVNLGLTLFSGDVRTYNPLIRSSITTTIRSGDVSVYYKFFPEALVVQPYVSAGLGLLYSDNYLARTQFAATMPIGLGLRISPFERVSFDLNVRQYTNFADLLDGHDGGSYFDNHLALSAGIIIAIGKNKDTDEDGIHDKKDKCPGTKTGSMVDENGCPLDRDGDGVDNKLDSCPDFAGLAKFNGCPDGDNDGIEDSKDACPKVAGLALFNGCPDSDGDGIEDAKDTCPNDPGIAKFNGCPDKDKDGVEDSKDKCPDVAGVVALDGCPDGDGDGIADSKDRCPTVAGLPAYGGCPAPKVADIKKLEAIAKKINFETGKVSMKPASFIVLNQVVALMKANPTYKLSIEGHTDNVGSSKMNLELSQGRADAVKAYLLSKGVDESNLVSAGFGDTKPIDNNKTPKGRANNRRSELKLF